ncbi:Alcohol dehydrogenase GroES-like domain, partial [Geosmithia morbida]
MKQAIVSANANVVIEDSPIPTPSDNELLVKVMIAGTNPKDWKFPTIETPHNSGDDVAGIVEAVGPGVWEFAKGDRVAGVHAFPDPGGAYAEYAILPAHQTFRLPPNISFEEGATVPLAALAASFGLFYTLELPSAWNGHPLNPTPLLVYGASSAVGSYAIKLALSCGIHPIVAVGSANSSFVEPLLVAEEGDVLLDYTAYHDPQDLADAIREAFEMAGIHRGRTPYALDAVSLPGTFDKVVSKAMAGPPINGRKPHLAVMLPGQDYSSVDGSIQVSEVYTGVAHQGGNVGRRFAYLACRMFSLGLREGWLPPHPHEVREEGLEVLQEVLQMSMRGKIHGKKIVLRVAE